MVKVPLPDKLPGRFAVLIWDRDSEVFILHTDDEARSSYRISGGVSIVRAVLSRQYRFTVLFAEECIDRAVEFGGVQIIPDQERSIPVYKKPETPELEWAEPSRQGGMIYV